jgi:hypothetical protein
MGNEFVELLERASIDEKVDALSCRELAALVLFRYAFLSSA